MKEVFENFFVFFHVRFTVLGWSSICSFLKNQKMFIKFVSSISTCFLTMGPKDGINDMMKILIGIYTRPESEIFREPVNWKALELLDYPDIVKCKIYTCK